MRTAKSPAETAAAIHDLAGHRPLRGAVKGQEFWMGGGDGLGGLYPYGTGELEATPVGTQIRLVLGMNPVLYMVEIVVIGLIALWTAAAIFAGLLHEAGILPVSVAWRPYAGVAALLIAVAAMIGEHRLGTRQKAALLDRLRERTESEAGEA